MRKLSRICLIVLPFLLALAGRPALAVDGDSEWTPTPPRLSFVDGDVSHWRPGADDWARARANLALAEGDALYTGSEANFEVQFGSRSFVRADEKTQLSLLQQEQRRIQFKVTGGRVSFDLRSLAVGDVVEVSAPDAVFVIEHPGYYRVEVNSRDVHFITRRGGEATAITADGRSLDIYPSEEIVVTAGDPVRVATYAAPDPDAWDRWNDERSDRIGESISARYLPPGVYGAEELDHYGHWRIVSSYGPVWIPYGVSVGWVPYSTGYWIWDPFYAWTWVDDAPWGWAPFHYGRWIFIDGFWAWAPGPVVRRPVYSPALVAFMIRDGNGSGWLSVGLSGVWWVALGWGEPVLPWWGPPARRWRPYWGGWGGPRIVNNVVIPQAAVIDAKDIRFQNAALPRTVVTVPADKFGKERVRATAERRYRHTDFAPVRGELPVKPSSASVSGGAPRGVQPPRDIVSRPVVSTRMPRERAPAWQGEKPAVRTQSAPESRYVIPPARRTEAPRAVSRPPFGAESGPERAPQPRPPRYEAVKNPVAPQPAVNPRSQATPREPATERREARPATPAQASPATPASQAPARAQTAQPRGELRQEQMERPLPGQPANQIYRGRDRDSRDAR